MKLLHQAPIKHRHTNDGVSACPMQVRYQCVLDTSTTHLQHVVLRVPFEKYYFSTPTRVGHAWIWLRHGLDARQMWLDMAWIRLEHDLVLFFSIL